MTWYGLVNKASGDLVSVGTEAMFPGGDINALPQYDRVTFGANAPDFSTVLWDSATRALAARPAPVILSRLDDIEALLAVDPDWSTAWAALNATRRNQIRTGWRRILLAILGSHANRRQDEPVEL